MNLLVSYLVPFFLASAAASGLSDIDTYPHKSAISLLEARGIVSGYPDGTFRPHKPINRAEFLKLLMLSVYGDQALQTGSERCFTDFTQQYEWYWQYACSAKSAGIIHGHPDGTFRAEDTIILAEALKMALNAWDVPLPEDDAGSPWYAKYMDAAATRGIFRRFPYTPDYQMTRGEMALMFVMLGEPIAVLDSNAVPPTARKNNRLLSPAQSTCGNALVEGAEQCDDGNTKDGDGCSSICVVVPEPIYRGMIQIEQQFINSTDQAAGAKDQPIFAFTVTAGRQDAFLTGLKLIKDSGSLSFAQNYRLFIDKDGDGTTESLYGKALLSGETIAFGDLHIPVRQGAASRVELLADMKPSFTPGTIKVAFDVSQPDFAEGVGAIDGKDITGIRLNDETCDHVSICWITVMTNDGQAVSVSGNGALSVEQSTGSVGSRQLIAGSTTPSLLILKFRGEAEAIVVKKLAIEGVPPDVKHLEFLSTGSSQPFSTGRAGNCSAFVDGRFCTDQEFTVPKDADRLIIVRAVLKGDDDGAQSGRALTLTAAAIEARGEQSGRELDQSDITIEGGTGPTHTVLFSKITDIADSNPDPQHTLIAQGEMVFGQFSFRAKGESPVEITKLSFTVSAVNMSFDSSSFVLYNTENASVKTSCTGSATTGTITVTCDDMDVSDVSTEIAPDGTIHLALQGTVTDAQISPGISILQASLRNLGNPGITGTISWNDGVTSVNWADIGATAVQSTNYRLE